MSANIEFNKEIGTYSFVSNSEAPWHEHGTILDHAFTAEEAIKHANLGFDVEIRKLYTEDGGHIEVNESGETVAKTNKILVPNKFATIRSDNNVPLGVVGNTYTVLQNKDAFKFFDSIVGSGQAIYETAGVLGKGERIFITAKLPQKLVISPNDAIDQYLFITNSHDGTSAIKTAFTPVRIVCNNTLALALDKSTHKFSFRHTASAGKSLIDAGRMMGIVSAQGQDMQEAYKEMTKVKITDAQLKQFIVDAMNPKKEQIDEEEWSTRFKNIIDNVLEYHFTDEAQTMETTKGTLYGAVNAVSGYYNNVVNYKDSEDKLNKIVYGQAMRNSLKAYKMGIDVLTNGRSLN